MKDESTATNAKDALARLFVEFIGAPDWRRCRTIVEEFWPLLPAGFLGSLERIKEMDKSSNWALIVDECISTLRRCEEVGVAQAFEEKPKEGGPLQAVAPAILEAFREFHVAKSSEKEGVLARYPLLATDQAVALLRDISSKIDKPDLRNDFEWDVDLIVELRDVNRALQHLRAGQAMSASDPERSIESFVEAEKLFDRLSLPIESAIARVNRATTLLRQQNGAAAIEPLEQALAVFQEHGEALKATLARVNLGLAYAATDRRREAVECFRLAFGSLDAREMPDEWSIAGNGLAESLLAMAPEPGLEDEAFKVYRRISDELREQQRVELYAESLASMGEAYLRGNDESPERLGLAIDALKGSCDAFDQLVALEATAPDQPRDEPSDRGTHHVVRFKPSARTLEQAKALRALGRAYDRRSADKDFADNERAIACYERAKALLANIGEPWDWAVCQQFLGTAYLKRRQGDGRDNVRRAVEACRASLTVLTRAEYPEEWALAKMHLGNALVDPRGADADSIEEAIQCFVESLEERTPEKSPVNWAHSTMNLGSAYLQRVHGDRADNLERAIACCDRALLVFSRTATPSLWATATNNLGEAYRRRVRGARNFNLKTAITNFEAALTVTSREVAPLDWADTMTNLGNAYAELTSGDEAVRSAKAVEAYTAALTVRTREAMPFEWATLQNNLGGVYSMRAQQGFVEDRSLAVASFERSLEVRTRGAMPAEWATTMANLAKLLGQAAGDRTSDDFKRAAAAWSSALEVYRPDTYPARCQKVAKDLGDFYFLHECWAEAASAFGVALTAGDILFESSLSMSSRERELGSQGELYGRAAYAAALGGDTAQAVTIIEHGRARLLGDRLDYEGAALGSLLRESPEEHQEYVAATGRLREAEARIASLMDSAPSASPQIEEARIAVESAGRRVAEVVARIRAIPGCARFARPCCLAEIAGALETASAIVYMIATSSGGLALVVSRTAGALPESDAPVSIDVVRLGDVTTQTLETWLSSRDDALPGWITANLELQDSHDRFESVLDRITGELGTRVMQPILQRLEERSVATAVLIPTGWLALLPVQAAWRRENGHLRHIVDDLTVTFSASARVLAHTRWVAARAPASRITMVQEPRPVTRGAALAGASLEVAAVAAMFEAPRVLRYEEATRDEVAEALSGAEIAHFACHGTANWQFPLESGLLMSNDEILTVRAIAERVGSGARLAVLSACETGIVDHRLPEEVVALPSAFIQAGFACVVASTWPVPDLSTALLMEEFYRQWRNESKTPARALREAQAWIRKVTAAELADRLQAAMFAPSESDAEARADLSGAWRFFVSTPPASCPFADSYYWAAFVIYGC